MDSENIQEVETPSVLPNPCVQKVAFELNTTSLTQPDQIVKVFECMDANADGKINPDELCKMLDCNAMGATEESLLATLDRNGDGEVSMAEFDSDLSGTIAQNQGTSATHESHRVTLLCILSFVLVVLYTQ